MTVNPDLSYFFGYDEGFDREEIQMNCIHSWVAGIMYVHDEDLDEISKTRKVECEKCEKVYNPNNSDDQEFPYVIETDANGFDMVTRIDSL